MKKLISVLLCFVLLFSLGVFAVAEEAPHTAKPTVCITAQDAYSSEQEDSSSIARFDVLMIQVLDVKDFARCEINVTLNTPPYSKMPSITDFEDPNNISNCKNNIQKQTDGSYTITLKTPIENKDAPYAAFIFTSAEDVPLEFTVNGVKLHTADGEIEKNDFVLDERRINGAGDFVRYDLDGNDKITAEDARLALRFAVGLDTATDEQCRAVGVADANGITAETARFILRAAVGLEGYAEKVVTNAEWAADGEIGYVVYHYSDGTYETVGPLDAWNERPDWV
ncbi:MAG: hypothetical protein E7523_09030 [Ruminococcaceae bacterium]|nr:hypothetical protein [Oscillospiraceae bacterium]